MICMCIKFYINYLISRMYKFSCPMQFKILVKNSKSSIHITSSYFCE